MILYLIILHFFINIRLQVVINKTDKYYVTTEIIEQKMPRISNIKIILFIQNIYINKYMYFTNNSSKEIYIIFYGMTKYDGSVEPVSSIEYVIIFPPSFYIIMHVLLYASKSTVNNKRNDSLVSLGSCVTCMFLSIFHTSTHTHATLQHFRALSYVFFTC